ncbi:hypothetical protein NQ315_015706 [Exocentrus adspersus]|uniref:Transposase n=1 Tax=Exocentrus adspersus TaxID=1586481 RepID=A0AAV8W3A1_9CUCU|nr:hypothetical protein NQ315_015706 [Exocentrus adspersus]
MYKRVCSKHFRLEDYEDRIQASIMNTKPKRLKKTAVPSLLLPYEFKPRLPPPKILPEHIKTECETEEENILVHFEDNSQADIHMTLIVPKTNSDTVKENYQILTKENELLKKENDHLKEECIQLQNRITQLEGSFKKENLNLKQKCVQLEDKVARLEGDLKEFNSRFEEKVKQRFKHFLSPNQVDVVLKKQCRVRRWSKDELLKAFTLRCLSRKSYIYVRETLNYPLPAKSTLEKFVSTGVFRPEPNSCTVGVAKKLYNGSLAKEIVVERLPTKISLPSIGETYHSVRLE